MKPSTAVLLVGVRPAYAVASTSTELVRGTWIVYYNYYSTTPSRSTAFSRKELFPSDSMHRTNSNSFSRQIVCIGHSDNFKLQVGALSTTLPLAVDMSTQGPSYLLVKTCPRSLARRPCSVASVVEENQAVNALRCAGALHQEKCVGAVVPLGALRVICALQAGESQDALSR